MMRDTKVRAFALGLCMMLLMPVIAGAQEAASAKPASVAASLPLTTKSKEARRLVEEAMTLYLDRVEQAQAIEILRTALKFDPDFAMGHEFLSWVSLDPAEQVSEQQKAFACRHTGSKPEQLLVEWSQDGADHNLISAITKMNDVLNQYPHDKWVVWMATWWLTQQTQYEHSIEIYENSGISDSPGLMNNQGYNYAYVRQFDKAFAEMDKYVAAMPNDSNPQDSYAEILRMAGRFDQAIEHYRASLAINPDFYSSQFGIADTYSMMGDQPRARREYMLGFQRFSLPELHRIQWQTREATTYVREGDYAGADKSFQAIVDYAHAKHMSQVEADTYRQMAMYQPNAKDALALLDKADAAILEGKNVMQAAIQQEQSQIQRARVEAAIKLGDKQMVDSTMRSLTAMGGSSDDKIIATAYHGAAGAALMFQRKDKEAISHLEEDMNNPLSLKLLVVAYEKTHKPAEAKQIEETLATFFKEPSLEQALVVPAFRKCYLESSCSEDSAALKR